MTNETQRWKAQITFGEFLERIHQSKHKNRDRDLDNFYEAYQIFTQTNKDLTDLNQKLGQSELNNSIMSAKIKELNRTIKDLKKGI